MNIVDRQGRVFGRMSLVDLGVVLFLAALSPLGYYGYRVLTTAEVERTEPEMVLNHRETRLLIFGRNFERQSVVRVGERVLAPVWYVNHRWLEVTVPKGVPPGEYPVTVTNPKGEVAMLIEPLLVKAPPPRQVAVLVTCLFDPSAQTWLEPGVRGGNLPDGNTSIEVMDVIIWGRKQAHVARDAVQANIREISNGAVATLDLPSGWMVANLSLLSDIEPLSNKLTRFSYRGQPLLPGAVVRMSIRGFEVEGFMLSWPVGLNTEPLPIE